MEKKILCSTGTIVGRANGFDHTLIARYANEICADGWELMMLKAYYGQLPEVCRTLARASLPVYTIHFEKDITALLGLGDEEDRKEGLRLFAENADMGREVGATSAVFHLWDGRFDACRLRHSIDLLETLFEICDRRSIELLVENVPCRTSPYESVLHIAERYPHSRFTFDTRHCDFIGETERFFASDIWKTRIAHIHVSDHCGLTAPGMWGVTRPIVHPGEGRIDFDKLFADMPPYDGETVTLESPVMLPDGTHNLEKLNRSLSFLRDKVKKY
jgi:sugar phosphate isomerase/epimerase